MKGDKLGWSLGVGLGRQERRGEITKEGRHKESPGEMGKLEGKEGEGTEKLEGERSADVKRGEGTDTT